MKHISAIFNLLALVCFSSCQSYESSGTPVQNAYTVQGIQQCFLASAVVYAEDVGTVLVAYVVYIAREYVLCLVNQGYMVAHLLNR